MKQGSPQSLQANSLEWEGDLFQRHLFAEFLTDYLKVKSRTPSGDLTPFSLALDAGWGRGKSFFVRHWAEALKRKTPRHPVMLFNAWAADVAADPLVAFMAAFKAALDAEVRALNLLPETKLAVQEGVEKIISGVRRSYLPAARVAFNGIVKKFSGIALEEVGEALISGDTDIDPARLDELETEGMLAAEKGLDEFFKKVLSEQTDHAKVISDLRAQIDSTLTLLASEGGLELPMVVFVDELDRCRPTFAIALIEGIKHLFGVRGVCYVVSTNMAQLAQATRAVYGPGFNGSGYLRRFFDVQCQLPEPSPLGFAESLFLGSSAMVAAQSRLSHGLPEGGLKDTEWGETAPAAFSWVADEFGLDFRSQQQVFAVVEASVSAIRARNIHLLWLAVLCAIRHLDAAVFEKLARRETTIDSAWVDLEVLTKSHTRVAYDANNHQAAEASLTLREVATQFYSNAFKLAKASARAPSTPFDYPKRWLGELQQAGQRGDSELQQYFSAVRSAGFISAD